MKRFLFLLCSCLLLTSCVTQIDQPSDDTVSDVSNENSDTGSEPKYEILIGRTTYTVDAYNPTEEVEGISVFDKNSGLTVSGTGKGYADILVFDSTVADIRTEQSTFMPFPNGYLVRMPLDKIGDIKLGDGVSVFNVDVSVNPKKYVLLKERLKIPVYYQNESRTAVVRAVLYDGDFIHDSTDTNIWGTEVAVDADGKVVENVPLGTEGVSGNTSIPEGGFVISSGNSLYVTMLSSAHIGDSARVVEEFGLYDFYSIDDLLYEYGTGEFLAKISEGRTRTDANAVEYAVDANGVIVSTSVGGNTAVPEGGFVLVATGVKRTELQRFCAVGKKVFDRSGKLYVFTDSSFSTDQMKKMVDDIKSSAAEAKKRMYTVDFKTVDARIADAETALENGEYETLADIITELQYSITPTFAVQERAAWVTDYDSDIADVKKTVAYASSLGLNTLFVAPYRDTYALYKTSLPHLSQHPDVKDDLLQAYVDECHKAGIQVVISVCTFATVKPSGQYSEDHFVNYFADKLLLSKRGRDVAYFYSAPSYTFNPYDSEIRQWFIDQITEVCANYDIDGVQLDYIRFPLPTAYGENNYEDFGYNEDIMTAFMNKVGTSRKPVDYSTTDELWERWCSFRCDIITSFVSDLRDAMPDDIPLSCTCFASADDRRKFVFQNIAAWTDDITAIYPMIYAATLEDQVKYGDETYAIIGDDCRIVLGIGTYDGETDEIVTQQHLYSVDFADGNAIFALNYTQVFGFDKTYKRLFASNAVRTDLDGITGEAYLKWMEYTAEHVYEYLYSCDLTEVKKKLTESADTLKPLTGDEYVSAAGNAVKDLTALAEKLPTEVQDDYLKKLDYFERLIKRS